jgi:hypothetical protein
MSPSKQRFVYYVLGSLALVALWYFVAYAPTSSSIKTVNDEITAAEGQLADYNRIASSLPSVLENDRNLEAERRNLNSSLYAKSDVLALFRQLTQDAESYDLKLVQISPPVSELLELNRQATINNNPLFLNITLDFEGQYVKFGQFVGGLETKPYFRSVKACLIRCQPIEPPRTDLSLSFRALLGASEETAS